MPNQLQSTCSSLTLGSYIISFEGVCGYDITNAPSDVPSYSVGAVSVIQRQMCGNVTVKIVYRDGVSECRPLEEILDKNIFATNVQVPFCPIQDPDIDAEQQNKIKIAFCSAKKFAKHNFCTTPEIMVFEKLEMHSVTARENDLFYAAISILVFVEFDMEADTPTLASRGFDKLPAPLQASTCVAPWLIGSRPGIGPSGDFGYWMGYTVDMREAVNLF
jgi:hypothetical protein